MKLRRIIKFPKNKNSSVKSNFEINQLKDKIVKKINLEIEDAKNLEKSEIKTYRNILKRKNFYILDSGKENNFIINKIERNFEINIYIPFTDPSLYNMLNSENSNSNVKNKKENSIKKNLENKKEKKPENSNEIIYMKDSGKIRKDNLFINLNNYRIDIINKKKKTSVIFFLNFYEKFKILFMGKNKKFNLEEIHQLILREEEIYFRSKRVEKNFRDFLEFFGIDENLHSIIPLIAIEVEKNNYHKWLEDNKSYFNN